MLPVEKKATLAPVLAAVVDCLLRRCSQVGGRGEGESRVALGGGSTGGAAGGT